MAVREKYNSLVGNIKNSGRKCLDIDNEQLRSDFQVFKSEVWFSLNEFVLTFKSALHFQVHELDYSLLKALKSSFGSFK